MRSLLSLLLVVAAGCSAPADPELSGPDAAAASPVTVRVTDDGASVAGAPVVFHAADGAVLAVRYADDDGMASAELSAVGSITVAHPPQLSPAVTRLQLISYTGVAPGDQLTVEIPRFGGTYPAPDLGPIAGTVEVELPEHPAARSYTIDLGCTVVSTETASARIEVPSACVGDDGKVDLTASAWSPPELSYRLATGFAAAVPVGPGPSTRVAIPDWIDPLPTLDVQLVQPPADATNAFAVAIMVSDGLSFAPVVAGSAVLSGADVTMTPAFLPGFTPLMDLEVWVLAGAGNQSSYFILGGPAEPTTVVPGELLLPSLGDPGAGADADRISWTGTASASGADATLAWLRSERREGAESRHRQWTVIAPGDATSPLRLPELPAELDDWRPRHDDLYLEPGVAILDVDWVDGYRRFLLDHGSRFIDEPCVPAFSTARVSRTGSTSGLRLLTGGY